MDSKLKIFVGEAEVYREYAMNTFLKHLPESGFEVTANEFPPGGKIPEGQDIYLLHVSHYSPEQIEDLCKEQPFSIVMLRTQTEYSVYVNLRVAFPFGVDGFYYPWLEERVMKFRERDEIDGDLAQKCFEILNGSVPRRSYWLRK